VSRFNTLRELITARRHIFDLARKAGPGLVAGLTFVHLLLGLLPVAFVVATAVVLGRVPAAVTGGLHSPAWGSLIDAFLVAASVFVAQQVLAPVGATLGELLARRADGLVYGDLMSVSMRSADIRPLEDQEALDELRTATRELEYHLFTPGQACAGLFTLIARYVQLVGYVVAIGVALNWPAALALGAAVLMLRLGQRSGLRRYAQARYDIIAAERKAEYMRDLAIQAPAGKEIRVFGLTGWMRRAYRQAHLDWLAPVWKARRRIYLWPFLWYASCALIVTSVVFGVIGATAGRALTLTGFVLVLQAALSALRLGDFYPEADLQTAIGMVGYEAGLRFQARIEALTPAEAPATAPAVPDPVREIHFDHVGFAYPGQSRAVFENLDLTIPVGRCTAIVGLNGAGKTTLVKLLARLYEPTTGAVRIDGVDIASYPVDEWRAKLGIIFQDFARYEVSAADNIGFGAVASLDDRAGIGDAARAVGLEETLNALPGGLDTPLARHLTGGSDLSGGQWQRIALARALFALRHGSPVVVLDEPTASLDVRAEAGFFDEFADLTRGATTLLISHRFSTVRHADLILVLEDGRVTEQGSHSELLDRDGRYAELFRLQANRFADFELEEAVG
jgi:ATP-binding cassette subfamily B protein